MNKYKIPSCCCDCQFRSSHNFYDTCHLFDYQMPRGYSVSSGIKPPECESGAVVTVTYPQTIDLKTKDFDEILDWARTQTEDKLELEILSLKDDYGYTVAHVMAYAGYIFTDPEILRLKDNDGCTVAHVMACKGYRFTNPEILRLKNNNGYTVANWTAEERIRHNAEWR